MKFASIQQIFLVSIAMVSAMPHGQDHVVPPTHDVTPTPPTDKVPTVIEALEADSAYSTLLSLALSSPAVADLLTTADGYTLFAPTNAAFDALAAARPELFKAVTDSPELLATVLSYHVLPSLVFLPANFPGKNFVATAATLKVGANVADGAVTISSGLLQSSTVTASITITAGIIHQVDQVLIPPQSISATAAEAGLTELTGALAGQSLVKMVEEMKDITVFAPTNEAFVALKAFADKNNVELTDAVLSAVLSIHLGQGVFFSTDIIAAGSAEVITALQGLGVTASIVEGGVRITAPANFATVVTADVLVANGVVHVIDTVLLPDLATLSATKETPSFGPLESTSESGASSVFAAGLVAVCAVLVF